MRLPCLAVAVAAPLLAPLTLSLPAQQPIRVVRHAPADTARSGDAITISFDRPVVGSLGRTPDPYRIVHLDPPTEARIEWRDPTTLRIIPRTPFVPGRRYRVTLSNDFVAVDERANSSTRSMPWLDGSWADGWWSPWEHEAKRDDRVVYFARVLWKGTYTATYVARATTAGTFVRPPAHAEEMYNPSVGGRTDGGTFRVLPRQ